MTGGETAWIDGPLARAVRSGNICYLDEIVEARKDTMVVIHPSFNLFHNTAVSTVHVTDGYIDLLQHVSILIANRITKFNILMLSNSLCRHQCA